MASASLYQPLDVSKGHIRLIKILPGEWNDPIKCKLVVMDWEIVANKNYNALSYEWGSPSSQREIMVQDILRTIRDPREPLEWLEPPPITSVVQRSNLDRRNLYQSTRCEGAQRPAEHDGRHIRLCRVRLRMAG